MNAISARLRGILKTQENELIFQIHEIARNNMLPNAMEIIAKLSQDLIILRKCIEELQ